MEGALGPPTTHSNMAFDVVIAQNEACAREFRRRQSHPKLHTVAVDRSG